MNDIHMYTCVITDDIILTPSVCLGFVLRAAVIQAFHELIVKSNEHSAGNC